MAYRALMQMQQKNQTEYGTLLSVPPLPACAANYGREALLFLRDCAEDLKFDPALSDLSDRLGRSSGPGQIPYNMERDLDRLSFERALGRFLASGSREDAFDIYYCYCEIFKPFGSGYDQTGLLLEMLSEHEYNASSLLIKHRDHYSHSVYVFCLGLAIYRNHKPFRDSYLAAYGLADNAAAACRFLEYWGLTSLFHDIGYPFEIAHQQMKSYVCTLDKRCNDEQGFAPYISYKGMDVFCESRLGDLNALLSAAVTERLALSYLGRTGVAPEPLRERLTAILRDRAVHENPADKDYLYMDHAYFSALMLTKTYLERHPEVCAPKDFPQDVQDAVCAILLHNSLFKFTLRSFLGTKEPLRLSDGQPLAYLLMLCDELQCWDRTCYGQNTRSSVFAFDFDIGFPQESSLRLHYLFDSAYEAATLHSKNYKNMLSDGYTKKSGAVRAGRSKFLDDIDEIISLRDMIPDFEPNVSRPDPSGAISVTLAPKEKHTGLYLSDSNYLNLYEFALALNGRYLDVQSADEMSRAFEENLSLEYKLSNIAQAKGFAAVLETVGCFYTDRAVDYAPVTQFTEEDLACIAPAEHERWCREKESMGWQYGTLHLGRGAAGSQDKALREMLRLHHDLVPFESLSDAEQRKDSAPMMKMLELIKQYEGLTIYRM